MVGLEGSAHPTGDPRTMRYHFNMSTPLLRAFFLSITLISFAYGEPPKYEPLYLWPDGASQAKGSDEKDKPSLAVYAPEKSKANGAAIIIAPGGGYHVHAIDHEGAQVAKLLNAQGITVFILKYRLKSGGYQPDVSLLDAKRAVRFVRSKAKDFHISPTRIGMLGFSAGGHLTSATGTDFNAGDEKASDVVERESSRPDFLVLCYPVISETLNKGYVSTHTKVTDKTPPTFIWFTSEDNLNPEHGILFYQALRKAKVEAEIHIYARGVHGLGLAPGDPSVKQWPAQLSTWLRNGGWYTDAKRMSVTGVVTIDGKPLHRGWVTLIPEDEKQPVACAYITERAAGKFTIAERNGPTAGKHRIIVHEVAQKFLTIPSMDDARSFETDKPNGQPLTVTLEAQPQAIVVAVESK